MTVPASIECQSEIDKDLVRSYYGDLGAFYRVRAALAATPAVGGKAVAWLVLSEETGNTRIWWRDEERAKAWATKHNKPLIPLYAAQPASPLRGNICCYCDAPLSCAVCGMEQPDDTASPPEQPAAAPVTALEWMPMSTAPKDAEIIGQESDGRIFNLRWEADDSGENWYDMHGDQLAYPVRWIPMPPRTET